MTICDLCNQHISKRYVLSKGKQLNLINLPAHYLKNLTDDDIFYIEQVAAHGLDACNSCKHLCNIDASECTMKVNYKGQDITLGPQQVKNLQIQKNILHREIEDKRVIDAVKKEKQRRINLIEIMLQLREKQKLK